MTTEKEAENLLPHTQEEIAEALRLHKLWLDSEFKEGEQFALKRLQGKILCWKNLRKADLQDADLRDAILEDADLWNANLRDANLEGAILKGADLRYADLRGADLRGANIRDAILEGADLTDIITDENTKGLEK